MPPRRKRDEDFDMLAGLRQLGEQITKQAIRPNIHGYTPHEKQEIFHKSQAYGRLFIGGNRSGKTVGGVAEDIYWLRRDHPHRKLPISPGEPVRGRVVGVDFKEGVYGILIPEYKRWLPPSLLINGSWDDSYSKSLDILTLSNGSQIEFMSYEQDTAKFAGVSRHFVHFDEEAPKHIYDECMMRLLDTDGSWWITMTPLLGMTWLYDDIYLKAKEEGNEELLKVIEVSNSENPYLPQAGRKRILEGLSSDDDRAAREHGTFIEVGGKIFKDFSVETHVIENFNPNTAPNGPWRVYMSIDSGWKNPTAIMWHAVNPIGQVVTFAEHYASEMLVADHVKAIESIEKAFGIKDVFIRTGDPAMRQTREGTGTSMQQEYAMRGIYLSLENVPAGPGSVAVGIARMQQYMSGAWKITRNCTNLVRELGRLHWATYASKNMQQNKNPQENVHKKDDHAFDSCFPAGTLIETPTGPVPIEEVSTGDFVQTSAGVRQALTAGPVKITDKFVVVEHEHGVLAGTPEHRVMTSRGWVTLDSLRYSDTLEVKYALNGLPVIGTARPSTVPSRVLGLRVEQRKMQPVYDLSVEGNPEYFANGVRVHNCRYFFTLMPDLSPEAIEQARTQLVNGPVIPKMRYDEYLVAKSKADAERNGTGGGNWTTTETFATI